MAHGREIIWRGYRVGAGILLAEQQRLVPGQIALSTHTHRVSVQAQHKFQLGAY